MAEKEVYNFGHPDRKSVPVGRVTTQELLGRGSYKKVYDAKVEGDDREFVLSEFNDNFDEEDSTLEYKFAYQLAKFDIASVPTYIQISKDKTLFLPTERVLHDRIKLSYGAKFLTLKLICGEDMIRALMGYPEFFRKLRELYRELIDITETVYTDTKVGNVCYDPTSGKIKIVDVDKQFFPKLSKEMIVNQKEQWLDYMIFQTWVIEYNTPGIQIELADSGLDESKVKDMLEVLINTKDNFAGNTPILNLCWYSSHTDKEFRDLQTKFIKNGADAMYKYIIFGDSGIFSGGRRRTIRRKQSKKRKTRKNGKK